jgi:IS5 family transposase
MVRMYVAQQCFGLLDESIEDAIYDSHSIRASVGFGLVQELAPGATRLLKSRHLLEVNELTRQISMRSTDT